MKSRAAVAFEAGKPLQIVEVDVVPPKKGEVLVLVTGRRWLGTAFGGVKGRSELPGMVEDAMAGRIRLQPLVTHTAPLSGINEAFDLMHAGKSIRSVVHY